MQEVKSGRPRHYTAEEEAKVLEMKDRTISEIVDTILLPPYTIRTIFNNNGLQEYRSQVSYPRGLAFCDPETRKRVATDGGTAVSRDREHMARIGRLGGLKVSSNRDHMAAMGKIGGAKVSQDSAWMAKIGAMGGKKSRRGTAK